MNIHSFIQVMKLMSLLTNIIAPLLLHSCLFSCTAIDTLTQTQFLKDSEFIISNDSTFKMGFFSPNGSTNRYVGIWFNDASPVNVIWVANRDNPLNDSSGVFTISKNGNLLVLNGKNENLWSSNYSSSAAANVNATAQLLDSGNLVLQESNSTTLWESFENPSDSFLVKMKLRTNPKTGEKTLLKSWKSPMDPSVGRFSAGLVVPLTLPEFFIWNEEGRPYWRSGPWNNQIFIGVPSMNSAYVDGFDIGDEDDGSKYWITKYANTSKLSNFVLNSQGVLKRIFQKDGKNEIWEDSWVSQESECDVYGKCGAYGSCNVRKKPICSCLRGFEPKNREEWDRGNWTNGCVRLVQFQCERIRSGGKVGKEDGFLKLEMAKVPDFAIWSSSLDGKCRDRCFDNCSCVAYALDSGLGCISWFEDLIDVQEFSFGGLDLYIRVAYSELDKKQDVKVIIAIATILGTLTIAICIYFIWRWMTKQKGKEKSKMVLLFNRGDANPNFLEENMNQAKLQELPVFSFATLATATDNFDMANKLGQGGFGPVYRGKLPFGGQEIAVKRLSRASGQGLEEFMNEVVVISKLQHRNLVRLLGCCIEGDEKMLVYECMPNKSLDAFLFDALKRELLHWRKRFEIIEGIGRGLLYLHRDSRLRIIHRDLKASNILLDEDLNPKISDFGMARIFENNQNQADTNRVVGTYGYMSPEYAMEGRFSEKSDVFSFGVLLLEIVSGRRNSSFYNDDHSSSLLGFVWKLWNEDNIVALMDPVISCDPSNKSETLRCIHVGLLCVQEFSKDRPSVSTLLSMLSSEILDLPIPKQPAFTGRQFGSSSSNTKSSSQRLRLGHGQSQKVYSVNNVTVTIVEGR